MKKLVLIVLVAILGALNANAQEVDSGTTEQMSIVDSLSKELAQLRQEYDYLYCSSQLSEASHEIQIFRNEINISSNSLLANIFHMKFDVDVYVAQSELYNAFVENLSSSKKKVEGLKVLISLKKISSNFSDTEIGVLDSYCDFLDSNLATAEKAVEYFKVVLGLYKDMR